MFSPAKLAVVERSHFFPQFFLSSSDFKDSFSKTSSLWAVILATEDVKDWFRLPACNDGWREHQLHLLLQSLRGKRNFKFLLPLVSSPLWSGYLFLNWMFWDLFWTLLCWEPVTVRRVSSYTLLTNVASWLCALKGHGAHAENLASHHWKRRGLLSHFFPLAPKLKWLGAWRFSQRLEHLSP